MFVSCVEGLFVFTDQANWITGCLIFHYFKRNKDVSNHFRDFSDLGPNSWNIFSQEVTCMTALIAKIALYCADSNFSQK